MSETMYDYPYDPSQDSGTVHVSHNQTPRQIANTTAEPIYRSPESQTLDESIAEFYDAWKMPETIERQQAIQFYDVFISARDNLVDISLISRLTESMKQYHWLYFGSDIDLPAGTLVIDKDSLLDNHSVSQNGLISTKLPLNPKDPSTISSEIYRRGLAEIDKQRLAIRLDSPKLAEIYRNILITSPQFQFLKSFAQTPEKNCERPLTDFEKQIETARAVADFRRKYGIGDGVRHGNLPSLALRKELARKTHQIDNITKPIKSIPKSPIEKAREFFLQDIKQWAASQMPEAADLFSGSHLAENGIEPFFRERYAKYLNEKLGGRSTDLFDGERLISAYLDCLINGPELVNSLEECLEYSLSRLNVNQTSIAHLFSERYISAARLIQLRGGKKLNLMTIEQGDTNLKPIQFFKLPSSANIFIEKQANVTGKSDYEAKENHVMSFVERNVDLLDTTDRLLEFEVAYLGRTVEKRQKLSNANIDKFDLKLTLTEPTEMLARIVGYDLVAVRGNELYFSKSIEADPYAMPLRDIDEFERQRMIKLAESYGATLLASNLAREQKLTVSELVQLIRNTSDYTFDESINEQSGVIPGVGLKDGRLQMQCDGAAVILYKMLSEMDCGYSVIARGLVVDSRKDVISASSHVEVEWYDEIGNVYRLDATPNGEAPSNELDKQFSAGRQNFIGRLLTRQGKSEGRKSKLEEQVKKPEIIKPTLPAVVEVSRPEPTIADIAAQIELNLRAIIGAKDSQELYEKAIKLNEADPARRTLEATLQLRKDPQAEVDLQKLSEYLNNLIKADAKLLKQIGIPKYQSGTLQMLQSFVQQLSSLPKV